MSGPQQLEQHRVVRRLRDSGCRRIGVAACGGDFDLDEVARMLAQALCSADDVAVAVLTSDQRAAALEERLAGLGATYAHVLVPLNRLRRRGEELRGCDLVDGVVLLARCGKTTEAELLARRAELGGTPLLGVVLLE